VTPADLPALLANAGTWWFEQMRALVPAWLGRQLPKAASMATLRMRDDRWLISGPDDVRPTIELDPRENDKALANRVLEAAPALKLSKLALIVPREWTLRRQLQLPLLPDREVRSAIELQLDRVSPFNVDTARFDVRVVSRDSAAGTMAVDALIVSRATIEAAEARLAVLGLRPFAIDSESAAGQREGFNLLAAEAKAEPRRALAINAGIVCAVAAIWYVAMMSWQAARDREVEAWRAHIGELAPAAQRAIAMRQQLELMGEHFAVAREHKPGFSLEVLAELTRALPETARLTELRFAGDTIDLTGVAQDAPSLIPRLEASAVFKDVKFRSPVMRRPETGLERFEITMTFERRRQ
jgi:general secretion pathway protein L